MTLDRPSGQSTLVARKGRRWRRLPSDTLTSTARRSTGPAPSRAPLQTFADRGLADRCEFVGGDFFNEVPAGADTYLLSAILHDWDDERCQQSLQKCRRAISKTGCLLVVDIVLSDEKNVADTYRNCGEDLAAATRRH